MKDELVFLLALFLSGLIWLAIVPVWHFPDEQVHFAQVAFLAEKGRNPEGNEPDLTEEILISEKLLGTERDNLGNNKFTFHPSYKIEHSDSIFGKFEASISALAKTESKKRFVKQEASRYPVLYYLPAALLYRLFSSMSLFVRVFAIRFWSLFLFMVNIYFVLLLGKMLFSKEKSHYLVLPLLVGFQPMMVFANAGVNSDALGNLFFTIFIYLTGYLLMYGFSFKRIFSILAVMVLAVNAKPQFIVMVPITFFLFLLLVLRDKKSQKKYLWFMLTLMACASVLFTSYYFRIGPLRIIDSLINKFNLSSFLKFTREYTLSHTYREVLPWYWGVYDWLGVTYPRIVHRIINWVCLFSGVGFFVYLVKVIRSRKWKDKKIQAIIFFVFVNFFYFLAISLYDWLSWYTSKYPLGVQGRYFFPVISIHMFIIIIGWKEIFDWYLLKRWGLKIIGLLIIFLNFYAIYLISNTYYDTDSLSTFIIQVSQYKPLFFKGIGIIGLLFLYIITMMVFLLKYTNYPHEKKV